MRAADFPTLEMLWESKDPVEVLRSRFGFDSTGAVVHWLSSALDESWGVQLASCERVLMSDSNALAWVGTSSGRMVLKWSVAPEQNLRGSLPLHV
ncbi:MAG: putative phosphotransferase [Nocardioides sp.]|nr:putative phosphotransferase [Nocardioides sp.]